MSAQQASPPKEQSTTQGAQPVLQQPQDLAGRSASPEPLPQVSSGTHGGDPLGPCTGITEKSRSMNRVVLVGVMLVLAAALVPVMRLFLVPMVVAGTFVALFFPVYAWILRRVRGRQGIAALLCCGLLLVGLLVPTYVVVHLVALQAIRLYDLLGPQLRQLLARINEGSLSIGLLDRLPFLHWVRGIPFDAGATLTELIKTASAVGSTVLNRTSSGVFDLLLSLSITLFTMFYFFKDGERLLSRVKYLSPLRRDYEQMLTSRFLLVSRAIIKGNFVIALIQGLAGGATLLIFGVKGWLLWTVVMVFFSIVPMLGAWMVMVPTGIIVMLQGYVWEGLAIIAISVLVVSTLDNLLRPRLVGHDAKMHDLLIFFSTIGGIVVFGGLGFIVGPVLMALFVAVIDIYGIEFREELTAPGTGNTGKVPVVK